MGTMWNAGSMRRGFGWLLVVLFLVYVLLVGSRILYPLAHADEILRWASEYSIDPWLVAAVVRCESRFRADAVSSKGAVGLMQIMPETGAWIAAQLHVDPFDLARLAEPSVNLRFGTWYLASLLDRFGSVAPALRAYNAGPTNAERWIDEPHNVFPETKAYVRRIFDSVSVYRLYFTQPWIPRITPSLVL